MASPSASNATVDAATRVLEPADLGRLRAITDVALHPDGRHLVATIGWPDVETDSNRSVLECCDVDGGQRRRLSEGHADRQPRFSPDGDRLVFLRSRPKGPTRIAVLDWPTGAITEIASLPDGAGDVRWLDQHRLVVLGAKRPADQDGVGNDELARRPRILTRTDYRFNGRGWIHDRPGQVFVIDSIDEQAELRPIGLEGIDQGAIAPSPDGHFVAVTAMHADDGGESGGNIIWLVSTAPADDPSRPEPIQLSTPGGVWSGLVWHPDGTLAATGMVGRGVGFFRTHRVGLPEAAGGTSGPIPSVQPLGQADQNVGFGAGARTAVAVDGGFLFPGVRRGRIAVDRHGLDGSHTIVHEGAHQVLTFDATADGSIVVGAVTSPTRPAELWRLDGEPKRIIGLNDTLLASLDLAEVEEVTVTSPDGTEVHAFMTRPPASAPATGSDDGTGGRPGLLYIHGGPMFQYGLNFFDEFQMAAARGYVVIGGNPRGSDGYGEAWAQAITGDLGNLDWMDVTALADRLAADDEVDSGRLGIGGGSYGGFMTGWVLARDHRFSAGLVERAVTSWTTMFGTSDIGSWFTEMTIGANLEDDPDEVRRQSPLTYAADITTPTLIVHSEQDWRCPIEQAEQLFAAIRRNGGDAILVRFPGENHELSRSGIPSHRIERLEIVHEFYARHLGGADFGTNHLGQG